MKCRLKAPKLPSGRQSGADHDHDGNLGASMSASREFVFAAVADEPRQIASLLDGLDGSWRRRACAWAGMSRPWPPISSAPSRTAPRRFCGSRYVGEAWLVRSTSWRDVARGCRPAPFAPDPELAALAMDFLTGPWPFGFVPLGRLRGISLRADDLRRTWRGGTEIHGPVAALMMAVCGRTALGHLLDGPGLATGRLDLIFVQP